MKRAARRCLAALVCSVAAAPASGADEARRVTLPLVYASCIAGSADPTRIAVRATAKGPVVDFERAGTPPQETRDANLAFVSRRLFFTLKIGDTLIEFQGHATDRALVGMLSDERGAHPIDLPAIADGHRRCGRGA